MLFIGPFHKEGHLIAYIFVQNCYHTIAYSKLHVCLRIILLYVITLVFSRSGLSVATTSANN